MNATDLPRRTAHATHALLCAVDAEKMPVSASEVVVYDDEAVSAHATGTALAHARHLGLAHYTGRYWVPSALAYDLRPGLEGRYLADTARGDDR